MFKVWGQHVVVKQYTTVAIHRLYNGSCGELIFFSDDFEGLSVEMWHSGSAIEHFGVWTQQGIWIVRVSFTTLQ